LLLVLAAAACTSGEEGRVLRVVLEVDALTLGTGETSAPLGVTVETTGGASDAVRWSSDDEAVATVDADTGVVEGVSPGTARVTARSIADPTRAASLDVTVEPRPASLDELDLRVTAVGRLAATWTAPGATTIEIGCFAGDEVRNLADVPASEGATEIAIPASDCLTIRVFARSAAGDDSVEVVLENVVLNGHDAGVGSLRAVLDAAAPGTAVGFAADVDEVVLSSKQVQNPIDAHLILRKDVTIAGRAEDPVVVRADDTLASDIAGLDVLRTRLFYVAPETTVRLHGLVLTGGTFAAQGGAVRNDGDLTVTDSVLEGNRAWYRGGAVVTSDALRIERTVLRDNRALVTDEELDASFACIDDPSRGCSPGDSDAVAFAEGGSGGALYVAEGTAELIDTRLSGNRAVFSGGALYVAAGAEVVVREGDIADNVASDAGLDLESYSYGGGVANLGRYEMIGGTVAGNESDEVGGGLANGADDAPDAPMVLSDVIVTRNEAVEYGGGAINYHSGEPGNLVAENGTTFVINEAGIDGDDRLDVERPADGGPAPEGSALAAPAGVLAR
jgi:hypothetical protein